MRKLIAIIGLGILLLTGEDADIVGMTKINGENTEAEIFAEMPDEFSFSSGVGGWETVLFLEDDGTFYGEYHDSDLGSVGEDYPNGTNYICKFTGKFAEPEQVSETIYSTTIESMEIEREGEEYIENGIRHIVCQPYGLDNAEEIMLYLYGTGIAELPEGFRSWMLGNEMGPESLRAYGIYNVKEETAFSGVIHEKYEELCKLNGAYKNEAGDEVVIRLSSEMNEYSYDLGFVDWTPSGGQTEIGTITKNNKGGFNINLEDSVSYSFKITNYEAGSIEFFGDDKWAEALGTFRMQ